MSKLNLFLCCSSENLLKTEFCLFFSSCGKILLLYFVICFVRENWLTFIFFRKAFRALWPKFNNYPSYYGKMMHKTRSLDVIFAAY